ncbi:hypothetical protein HPB48_009757 [Haemaphysalis longicornis]|uniref:Uncharacterized protein n=1 Tax=Haemaphysalis longicornis TaxID=44386 RepID=A0A9J6GQB5_HAELO|nr:hypothetical protein HPB48_009757 [Haemaphysalis longicornis]
MTLSYQGFFHTRDTLPGSRDSRLVRPSRTHTVKGSSVGFLGSYNVRLQRSAVSAGQRAQLVGGSGMQLVPVLDNDSQPLRWHCVRHHDQRDGRLPAGRFVAFQPTWNCFEYIR